MVKKVETKNKFLDITFWVFVYSKIFFWCNRPFSFSNNHTNKPFQSEFLSRANRDLFLYEKKTRILGRTECREFCREIFYSISLMLYDSILNKSFNVCKPIYRETISKKKTFRLGIETSHLKVKSIRHLVSYLNRFYVKKSKHASLTDFYNLFLRSFLFPLILPSFSSFSLFIGASNLYFEKTFQKSHKEFFTWEKKFSYPNSSVFNQVLEKGVIKYFHALDICTNFSNDVISTKKIIRYLESTFVLEVSFLKHFSLKNSSNLSNYLVQKEHLIRVVHSRYFIFNFLGKNLEDFNEKFFLTFFRFFFGGNGLRCSFLLFLFVFIKIFTERKIKNSLIDFSIFNKFFFSFQLEQLFFEFPQNLLQQKGNFFEAFYKLDFLHNLNCLDSDLVKFRVLFFIGIENFSFLRRKKNQIKNLEKFSIENYLFNLKELGLYSFFFFVTFSTRSFCMAQLTKEFSLENKVSKYLFSLEDKMIEKRLNFSDQKFIVNKITSLNEIIRLLFNEKTLSEIQFSYFEARYRIVSNGIFNKKISNISNISKIEEIRKIGTQTVLYNSQFGAQGKNSQNINLKFFQNLKDWSTFIKNFGKKKKANPEYYNDLLSCVSTTFKVNLTGNKQALKIEKNLIFFPVSVFRCLRFFSRFFFMEMLKEKQLIWNFSQTRILLESSGLLCKDNFCFLIQVDFLDLFFLLALNKLQIVIDEDLNPFFSQKGEQNLERTKNLKKAGLIEEKVDKNLMRKFFVLEKNFFPNTKITKVFAFFELNLLFEQKNFTSKQLNDHIYISEAIIVKILKVQAKITTEKLLREAQKRLKKLFNPDIRGILLQTKVLCDKGYIQYNRKENSYQYFSD